MDDALHIRPVKTDGRSSASAATSSRAAANLSMERLYRKRAIDRENQRVLRQKNKARLAELEGEVRALTERLAQAEADKAQAAARTQTSSTSLEGIIASLRSLQVSLAVVNADTSTAGSSVGSGSAAGSSPGSSPLTTTASPVSGSAASVATTVAQTTSASSLSPSPASLQPDAKPGPMVRSGHSADQPMGGTQPFAGDAVSMNLDNVDFSGPGATVTVPVDDGVSFQNSDFSLDIDLLTRSLPLFADGHTHPPQHAQRAPSPTQLQPYLYPQYAAQHSPHSQQPQQLPPLSSDPQLAYPYTQGYVHRNPPGSIDFSAPSPPAPLPTTDSVRRSPPDDASAVYLARVEANRLRDASPVWAVTPPYVPPTSNVDDVIINLVYKRRRGQSVGSRAAMGASSTGRSLSTASAATTTTTGTSAGSTGSTTPSASVSVSTAATSPSDEFTHTHFPSVHSLLNPVLYEPDRPVASTIARHVAGTVMDYASPEKTALLYITCIYVRWLITPTREHYDAIPEFFRPTGAQLVVPHPVWIDTLGWPRARERIVSHLDHTRYRDFASILVKSLSIGWPHNGLEGILEARSELAGGSSSTTTGTATGDGKNYVITQAFVQHVREAKNWTVGPELVEAFPWLDGAVNVRGRLPVSYS
ncbi:hypothetical protein HMPREF1624_01880 [Sporothrix schenckii ATCC 58251]|uniref:BZIP domain-containing protein n=1 Tax=Sporothrix schenckii (strain ATCC 58251 / de Perez 2211183) TaxID=1391915 RepID=U7Q1R9_SPOS1|nr:hypothetical protein HMPREF1624_01880 [Sporothrix schenckii ATCC 58251]